MPTVTRSASQLPVEAGRLDCAGTAVRRTATGSCGFTADPAFAALLARNGVRRPTDDEAMAMMAVDVRSDLVSALGAARYPAATPGDLIALSALGVTSAYIGDLARTGYRPRSLNELTQFAALKITPDYIDRFARAGYRDIPADQLVQMRALDISPDMLAAFERIGYRPLPIDDLVQFKALGITPDFIQSFRRLGYPHLAADTLVQLKALDVTPEFVRSVNGTRRRAAVARKAGRNARARLHSHPAPLIRRAFKESFHDQPVASHPADPARIGRAGLLRRPKPSRNRAQTAAAPAVARQAGLYGPADFVRFAPRNALDMLRQVPGFIIRGAVEERGLGQASGNVLLNGQRVPSKSGGAIAELQKIPASNVERIEIVDAATLDIAGLTGQVANVVVTTGKKASGQFSWRPEFRAHFTQPIYTRGDISYSGKTGKLEYTLALDSQGSRSGAGGPTQIIDRVDGPRVPRRRLAGELR